MSAITAVVLACWVLASIGLCITGAFHPEAPKLIPGRSNAVPLLGAGMLIILALFLTAAPFRRTLKAVPQSWLVGAQIVRLVGFVVLSFGLAGTSRCPLLGPPAAEMGSQGSSPVVALMLHRGVPGGALAAWVWNAWGLGDLINVARLASLTTPGTSSFDPALGNNSNFALFPTGLLQVLYGPAYPAARLLLPGACSSSARTRSYRRRRFPVCLRITSRNLTLWIGVGLGRRSAR